MSKPIRVVCANAGRRPLEAGPADTVVVLLPLEPRSTATRFEMRSRNEHAVTVAVVITDTFGRAHMARGSNERCPRHSGSAALTRSTASAIEG